jgi:hypothetical protein
MTAQVLSEVMGEQQLYVNSTRCLLETAVEPYPVDQPVEKRHCFVFGSG